MDIRQSRHYRISPTLTFPLDTHKKGAIDQNVHIEQKKKRISQTVKYMTNIPGKFEIHASKTVSTALFKIKICLISRYVLCFIQPRNIPLSCFEKNEKE